MTIISQSQLSNATNLLVSSATINIGQVIVQYNNQLYLPDYTIPHLAVPFGIALTTKDADHYLFASLNGRVDPSIYNLGDGYICAVGYNSTGYAVRVTDPTCVSGLNYLGNCDDKGTIYVKPSLAIQYDVGATLTAADGYLKQGDAAHFLLDAYSAVSMKIRFLASNLARTKIATETHELLLTAANPTATILSHDTVWMPAGQTFAAQGWSITIDINAGNMRILVSPGSDTIRVLARIEFSVLQVLV
jgi:hypothetical protein